VSESIRIKIAKWLAPELALDIAALWHNNEYYRNGRNELCSVVAAQRKALKEIAGLRTPKCSHVVKKACDIADAALKTGEA
jgi:hypothetical protein